jgi:eukaryotic-like serine/threonine-protein kinase
MSSAATEGLCPRCLFAGLEESPPPEELEAGAEGSFEDPSSPGRPNQFGDYELIEEIGQGGMGMVYRARQLSLNRPAAVKVIKLGMDSRQIVARFEAERQALARMDHPNIAKVFDAGVTEAGRPYFAMELVAGLEITRYCDRHQLSTRQRLELFIQVCQAVQHAHQKGIIHRDLKPSNILVVEADRPGLVGCPKIIDFGIAKAVEGRLTDDTLFTAIEQFLGTPAYMSPEQATLTAVDVDTRSDIYSLGVLLYELLTGETPFDTKALLASGVDELRRTIREVDPVRPSTRLKERAPGVRRSKWRAELHEAGVGSADGAISDSRELVPPDVFPSAIANRKSQIANDLDWIVMKCLEKERDRRYESANGLAMDIQRHLNCEPVVARPPSRWYEFQKTVRRHKFGFAATATIMLVLMAGVLGSSWQAVRARNAEREQSRLRAAAEAQAYASDMNVAMQALKANDLGRTRSLLDRHRPQPGQKDLRGWEWRYLWDQSRSDAEFDLCQRSSEIHSLAASQDGRWLAVGETHRGGVEVWDLPSRRVWARLSEDGERSLTTFSPVAPLLAYTSFRVSEIGEWKSTLHLWNVERQREEFAAVLEGECVGLEFSSDGGRLVTSTSFNITANSKEEGRITVWRVLGRGGLEMQVQHASLHYGTELATTDFAATRELDRVAYGTGDGHIRVLDLESGRQVWTPLETRVHWVNALAFSPDGKTLAVAADFRNSDIDLWDVETQRKVHRLEGHAAHVTALQFTPDGGRLISASADQTVRIWDLASKECLDVLRGHRQEVWRVKLLPDGKTLVSGAKDGTVSIWDTSVQHPRRPRSSIRWTIWNWRFASDSQSVLALDTDRRVKRYRMDDLRETETLFELNDPSALLRPGSLSESGMLLAAGSSNGVVRVWNLAKQTVEHRLIAPVERPVMSYSFLAADSLLVTVTTDLTNVQLWDLRTSRLLHAWTPFYPPGGIADGPLDGELMEFGSNRSLRFVSLEDFHESTRELNFLEANTGAFSPDRKLFAISSYMGYVRIWDTATWLEQITLAGFLSEVRDLQFSADGRRLATVGANPQEAVKLWDTDNWLDVLTLESEGTAAHQGVAFSPDGNAIGVTERYNSLILWRAPSWEEIDAAEYSAGSSETPK